MRVIAGRLRGRRIDAPAGGSVRPTYDRVRESIFGTIGVEVEDARVLDLFAGSGSLGIECLSRGARSATFVEIDPAVAAVARSNVERLGLGAQSTFIVSDAIRFLSRNLPGEPFHLVFLDPPYGSGLADRALSLLGTWDGARPGALVVAEHGADEELRESLGALRRIGQRRYGATGVDLFRAAPIDGPEKEEA